MAAHDIDDTAEGYLLALVVEPDGPKRQEVSQLLLRHGVRVESCESVEQGRNLFNDHAFVVAPVNGDNAAVMDFVHWLRTRAGRAQPYILGLGDYVAPASEWHGFNEFVPPPVNDSKLQLSLEAARRWHGWMTGLLGKPAPAASLTTAPQDAESAAASPFNNAGGGPDSFDFGAGSIFREADESDALLPPSATADDPSFWSVGDTFSEPKARPAPITERPFNWDSPEPFAAAEITESPEIQIYSPAKEPAAVPEPVETSANSQLPRLNALSPAPEPAAGAEDPDFLLYREMAEAAPYGVMVLDEEAEVVYANPKHRTITGRSLAECGGLQGWLEDGCAADAGNRRRTLDEWWERVWKQRFTSALTMRNGEGILKEIEFRPAPLGNSRLLLTVFDVTDNRREEEALRASEARFRSICQQSPAGVVLLNATGNITDVNLTFERLSACSRLDVRRIGLQKFFPEADHDSITAAAAAVARGETAEPILTSLLPRRGDALPVVLGISIVKNTQGAAVFTAYHLQPLPKGFSSPPPATARSTEPEMPSSRRLADIVPDLLLEIDGGGRVLLHSQSRDFHDLTPDGADFSGQPLDKAFPELAEVLPLEEILSQLEANPDEEVRCEITLRRPENPAPQHCEVRGILRRDGDGKPSGRCALVIRDVTRLKEARSDAAAPEPVGGFGFSAIKLLRQAAIVTNEKGRIVELNPSAEEMFGYTREELAGSGLYKLFLPDQPKEFAARISQHINKHRCWIGRSSYFRKDGAKRRLSIELVPYEEAGSRGFLGLMRDITEEENPAASPPAPPAAAAPAAVTLHRARNDLQVLSSLLGMQAADQGMSEEARHAVQQSKDRVAAVALVYRLLNAATGEVPFQSYAGELAAQLLRSHRISDDRVQVSVTGTAVALPQKLALTAGIILRELIDGALALHFPKDTRGTLTISLTSGSGEAVLSVKDDAPLQTSAETEARKESFNWQIIEMLAEQIRADIRVLRDIENETRLRFRIDGANSRE